MRIISQDGDFDLPYESCIIWIHNKTEIKASPLGEPDSNYTFANYSTPEKAEKAMQLLHKAYSGMPIIFQNVEIPEIDADQLKGILNCSIIASIPNEPSKAEYINKAVFQFPKEEDL